MARLSRGQLNAALRWKMAVMLNLKNAEAPEGKHYSFEVNDYVDNPTCDEGYHWSNDTYRCEPDE